MNIVLLVHTHNWASLFIVMLFQVEQEILQVGMKRATEKRDNSVFVCEFSCTTKTLECELHSAE